MLNNGYEILTNNRLSLFKDTSSIAIRARGFVITEGEESILNLSRISIASREPSLESERQGEIEIISISL